MDDDDDDERESGEETSDDPFEKASFFEVRTALGRSLSRGAESEDSWSELASLAKSDAMADEHWEDSQARDYYPSPSPEAPSATSSPGSREQEQLRKLLDCVKQKMNAKQCLDGCCRDRCVKSSYAVACKGTVIR